MTVRKGQKINRDKRGYRAVEVTKEQINLFLGMVASGITERESLQSIGFHERTAWTWIRAGNEIEKEINSIVAQIEAYTDDDGGIISGLEDRVKVIRERYKQLRDDPRRNFYNRIKVAREKGRDRKMKKMVKRKRVSMKGARND